jgi:uncharacterized RDD family membrane protein YckC
MPAMSVSSTINSHSLEGTYPTLLRRFAIINYDSLLLIAVSMAYGLIYIGISKLIFGLETDRATGPLFQVGWLLCFFGFFCYFWMRGGQTTGMRAWRVQIVNIENKSPSFIQCIIRFILAPLGWLLFFTAFFDDKKQCLHDKWSQTQLIMLAKNKKP